MFRSLSLSSKLISGVMAIFIVIICIVSILNYKKTSQDTIEVFEGIQHLALNASYNTINITMHIEAQQHLEMLADALSQMDKNDIIAQRNILRDVASLIKYPSVYVTYDSDGKTLTEDYQPNNHKPMKEQWDNVDDLRNRPWYQAAKNANQLVITPTYESSVGANKGKLLSTAAMPIIKDGRFIGVVGLDIFVHEFQQRFQNFKRQELPSMRIFITDNTGRIFSHEDPAIVADPNPTSVEIALLEALKTSKEGKITYTRSSSNEESLAFYKQFPFGWTIVAAASKNDYTKAINEALLITSTLALILMLVGALVLFFIIKRMLRPMSQIQQGLLDFFRYLNYETKQAPAPIAIQSKDEFGAMATAINENIEKTHESLDQDSALVQDSLVAIQAAKDGSAVKRITHTGSNPYLNQLRDSVNELLELLCVAIGKDLHELNRVFDSYVKLDFSTSVANASGRVDMVTNTLGDEIRKMLHTSANFAKDLESKSKDLEEAVRTLTESSNTQASS
ncbi:methyl-accepting chemotaxis protein, partial [Helicobacter didelphidarum]